MMLVVTCLFLVLAGTLAATQTDYVMIPTALSFADFNTYVLNQNMKATMMLSPDPAWYNNPLDSFNLNVTKDGDDYVFKPSFGKTDENGDPFCTYLTKYYYPDNSSTARFIFNGTFPLPVTPPANTIRLRFFFSDSPDKYVWEYNCKAYTPGSSTCPKAFSFIKLRTTAQSASHASGYQAMGLLGNLGGLTVYNFPQNPPIDC